MLKKDSGEKTLTTVIYKIQELQSQGNQKPLLQILEKLWLNIFFPKKVFFQVRHITFEKQEMNNPIVYQKYVYLAVDLWKIMLNIFQNSVRFHDTLC